MAISIDELIHCTCGNYKLYEVNIHGRLIETIVTPSRRIATSWINNYLPSPSYGHCHKIVGLDIEWRPTFCRNGSRNPIAIIQLCTGKQCLIFQLSHASSVPKSLYRALENPNITYTGVNISQDAEKLEDDYGLEIEDFEDIGEMASEIFGLKRFKRFGLKRFVQIFTNDEELEKPKHVTLSNWEAKRLSLEQVKYACVDAYYSYKCGKVCCLTID